MNANRSPLLGKPMVRVSAGLLIGGGAVLAFIATFADSLNIGVGEGFGYQQLMGVILGVVLILWGLALIFQRYLNSNARDSFESER